MPDDTPPSAAAAETPLFSVRRARWQGEMWRWFGLAVVAVAVIVVVQAVLAGGDDAAGGVLIGLLLAGIGGLLLLFSRGLARTRIDAYGDHLVVRSGLGRPRTVAAADIARLDPELTRWEGIVARDARKKLLFRALVAFQGAPQLAQWLEERRPAAWAEYLKVRSALV